MEMENPKRKAESQKRRTEWERGKWEGDMGNLEFRKRHHKRGKQSGKRKGKQEKQVKRKMEQDLEMEPEYVAIFSFSSLTFPVFHFLFRRWRTEMEKGMAIRMAKEKGGEPGWETEK